MDEDGDPSLNGDQKIDLGLVHRDSEIIQYDLNIREATPDYSQNPVWGNFIYNTPLLGPILRCLASPNSINLGGMHHRGNRTYTTESTGFIYLILFVILFFVDISILA